MFNNKFNVDEKRILITGASSGIGRETAIVLSNLGASLIICGRDENRLKEVQTNLINKEKHILFVGDLTDDAILNNLLSITDGLDGVVLSAGIVKTLPIKFLNKDEIQNIMSTNFEAPILLCQKLLKNKKINKGGSIVFLSSISGVLKAEMGNGVYAASKGALNAICKVIALEVASQKIRANSLCPGMVFSPLTQNGLKSISAGQLAKHQSLYPLGYGTPEDVAYCISYLLSDASKWMTGASIILDGGFSIN